MDFITILGLVAGALTTVALIPQLMRAWKTKSTKDVSMAMFAVTSIGVFLWLIYGIMIGALPVIVANALTFILASSILILKIKYG